MKLTSDAISKLDSLLQLSSIAGLEKLIIADGKIRGADEKLSVILLTDVGLPDLNGLQVAFNRLGVLRSRLSLINNMQDFSIDVTPAKNGKDISHLEFLAKGTKAQFRCAAVENMKGVPKSINDTVHWHVIVPGASARLLVQAVGAMEADTITLTAKQSGEVFFECIDKNADVFSNKLADSPTWVPVTPEPASKVFCDAYPAKSLLPLLTHASQKGAVDVNMLVGENGILTIIVADMEFFVIPTRT